MSETSLDITRSQFDTSSAAGAGSVGDFFALMKPRVMSLVVFTALVGLVIAPGSLHPVIAIAALLCIAVGAGASGALNMWYDADIDAKMQRTAARPIPRGAVSREEARTFGTILSLGSIISMGMLVNWVAASLLALTIGFYIFIYTMWLKRSTSQNIVIGGAAGALPPMIGWAAVTGSVSLESAVLFLIIFIWTPPHFWALAIYRKEEYALVDIPMLPVTHGVAFTRLQILLYTILLVIVTTLPYLTGMSGVVYLAGVSVLNAGFMWYALRMMISKDVLLPMHTFAFSITYLMVLFIFLLADHYIVNLLI